MGRKNSKGRDIVWEYKRLETKRNVNIIIEWKDLRIADDHGSIGELMAVGEYKAI